MNTTLLLIPGLVLALVGTPALAQTTGPAPAARGLDCMIQPHQIVQLGSPAAGVIENILVERGDLVTRGQNIVQLRADVERAALAMARERAQQQGELTVAVGAAELAQRELERAKELRAEKFVSQTFLDKQQAEAQVASGRTDQASERRKLSQREVTLAAAQLAQRTIAAPISGVVVERFMAPGEFVDQKPILRLASLDPLRVDVLVPAVASGQVEVGMKGAVMPELLQKGEYVATVRTVDRVIDAATNTFRVRLELPNPGNTLPAGLRCKVDLGLKLQVAASAAAALSPATSAATAPPATVMPVVARR